MLNDATGLKKIYLAAGYTDLRRGTGNTRLDRQSGFMVQFIEIGL